MKNFLNLPISLILFGFLNSLIKCEISDLRLCADPECKKIISLAKTKVSYPAGSDGVLSFKINSDVRVYSKSAGSNPLMWGVEIQGQRGYVSKDLLKETKILIKSADLTYEIPTNLEELRRKRLDKEQAKLKSSQPEEVVADTTTTAALPDLVTEKIITKQVDINSSTEKPSISAAHNKIVVDGTTVLIPVHPIQEDSAIGKTSEEEDDDGIIVTEGDEVENSTLEEEHEKEIKSEEIIPQQETLEQTNVRSSNFEQRSPVVSENHSTLSVELSQTNVTAEQPSSEPQDVKPATEDVSEHFSIDNIELGDQINNMVTPDSAEDTLNDNKVLNQQTNTVFSDNGLLAEDVRQYVVESLNIGEFSEQKNINWASSENVAFSGNAATAAVQDGTPIAGISDQFPTATLAEASFMPELDEKEKVGQPQVTVKEVSLNENLNYASNVFAFAPDSNQRSETVQSNYHASSTQSPDQLSKGREEHQRDLTPDRQEMSYILPGVTESSPLQIEQTTPYYEQEQFVPNPLHDSTATTSVNHEASNIRSDEVTTPSPSSTEYITESTGNDSASMSSVSLETEDSLSTMRYTASPENVVQTENDQKLVHNAHVSTTSVETDDIVTKQTPVHEHTASESKGLFDTILDTVKSFWSHLKTTEEKIDNFDEALEKLLYPQKDYSSEDMQQSKQANDMYCENLSPNSCPSSPKYSEQSAGFGPVITDGHHPKAITTGRDATAEQCLLESNFLSQIAKKLVEMIDFIVCLGITALTILVFTFGYYCISNGRKENSLISKLNIVERSLLASHKEVAIAKYDLIETRDKLASIENNSFGSNDMVIALKKELNDSEVEKNKLRDHVAGLEKELENAAEAGLELNKIVSELLNNQPGDDSIISSVEELQKQLNEQQNTILEINKTLAEKSRENSELQLVIGELNDKFQEEIDGLKSQNETLLNDRNALQSQVYNAKNIYEGEISIMVTQKNAEIEKLVKDLSVEVVKFDQMKRKHQASEARVEALEESLDSIKKNPNITMKDILKATENKTEVFSLKKERDSLKELLEGEMDARKLLEDHVKIVSEEVSALKQEYNQSEKEKLEAQTRLEVLSSYFKEKEMQLQKELSVKEAMWMKQQGETTSTVERVRLMQDEIQALKSQSDSFRAEIEAQSAAHKAQIASLENRAHETWLAARQSERKLEESRSEATTLRRKLTSIAENSLLSDIVLQNRVQNSVDGLQNHDINQASSPIHMESPGSPLLGGLPPPPLFLPRSFIGPPAPYMSMPPFIPPPGEMRPPPLGRLMSPPPPRPNRYSPSLVDDRDRYSPENGRYSPDSRYNYNTDIISTYDTETDFSPPPSPHSRSRGGGYNSRERECDRSSYKTFSPLPNADRSKKTKGVLSSGSGDSFDSRKAKGKGKGKVNV